MEAYNNHREYLDRMAQSANESTKSLIPFYFRGKRRILDVGCADGTMLLKLQDIFPKAELVGLDTCHESAELTRSNGFDVIEESITDYVSKQKYDGILFSSVLHEVSSYYPEEETRFTANPILEALSKSYDLLNDHGIVVIRDGIKGINLEKVCFKFNNPDDSFWITRFINSPSGKAIGAFFSMDSNGNIYTNATILKEFLMKYTWGENSWERESQEVVGILTVNEWIQLAKQVGFKIRMVTTSSERYLDYILPKIECDVLENIFRETMFMMILEKEIS